MSGEMRRVGKELVLSGHLLCLTPHLNLAGTVLVYSQYLGYPVR
jgi:hypothetical protein